MDLGVGREPALRQPFNDVGLPQRAVAVQQVAMQARNHGQQFPNASRMRQGQVAQVIVQLKLRVVLPVPEAPAQDRALVEGRQRRKMPTPAGQQLADEMGPRPWRRTVDVEARDMHGLVAGFHPQEGGICRAENFHDLALFGFHDALFSSAATRTPCRRSRGMSSANRRSPPTDASQSRTSACSSGFMARYASRVRCAIHRV